MNEPQDNTEPPELREAWAEEACDQIDAGFFSGDMFHSRDAIARIEWYIGRWQREIARIKDENFYES